MVGKINIFEQGIHTKNVNAQINDDSDSGERMSYPIVDLTAIAVSKGDESHYGYVDWAKFLGHIRVTQPGCRVRFRLVAEASAITPSLKETSMSDKDETSDIDAALYGSRQIIHTGPWQLISELHQTFSSVGGVVEAYFYKNLKFSYKVPKKDQKSPLSPWNSLLELVGPTEYCEAILYIEVDNTSLNTMTVDLRGAYEVGYTKKTLQKQW